MTQKYTLPTEPCQSGLDDSPANSYTPLMQDMMGGFFGLELPEYNNFPFDESDFCAFTNSGRTALACILDNLPRPRRIYIPRYICHTLAEPLTDFSTETYGCRADLSPILPDDAQQEDIIILVDYFGLTARHVLDAAAQFPGQVIVDATTALFSKSGEQFPTFYSPRKFVGVPDGGVACAPFPLVQRPEATTPTSAASLHLLQRIEGGVLSAAAAAQQAENALCGTRFAMSPLTRRLLRSINFQTVSQKRLSNYRTLHRSLASLNRLKLPEHPDSPPMYYPFVCGIPGMRDDLIDAGVALPLFWEEVIDTTPAHSTENTLARTLLPLPIDQRYDENDMQKLLRLIIP